MTAAKNRQRQNQHFKLLFFLKSYILAHQNFAYSNFSNHQTSAEADNVYFFDQICPKYVFLSKTKQTLTKS